MVESLPRSIRWRIHLGLLEDVSSSVNSEECSSSPNTTSNVLHSSSPSIPFTNDTDSNVKDAMDPLGAMYSVAPVNDRLPSRQSLQSDQMISQNAHHRQVGSSTSRPLFNESFTSNGKGIGNTSTSGTSINQQYLYKLQHHNHDLLKTHRQRFQDLLEKHYWQCSPLAIIEDAEVEERKSAEEEHANPPSIPKQKQKVSTMTSAVADPLSMMAMLQEKEVESEKARDLEERKERALAARNRQAANNKMQSSHDDETNKDIDTTTATRWTDFYSSRDVIDIIEKDLSRLPGDHHLCFCKRKNLHGGQGEVDENALADGRKERSHDLSKILFVYAKEHPALGYRQGMHELLSLVLLSIEIDLFEFEAKLDANVQKEGILDPSKTMHDAYIIFENIMAQLSPAYEVRDPDSMESRSPMEQMGQSILNKIKTVARDERLHDFISQVSVPPELYCTRWIRLMFSREVVGWENVMMLWDIFFKLRSESSTENETSATLRNTTLMDILETTAASMIFLIRDELLPPQYSLYANNGVYGNSFGDDKDPNESIELLMNYPPLHDSSRLIEVLHNMAQNRTFQVDDNHLNIHETGAQFNQSQFQQSQEQRSVPHQMPLQHQQIPDHYANDIHYFQSNMPPSNFEAPSIPTQQSNYPSSKGDTFGLPNSYERGASALMQATESALSKMSLTMSQGLKKLSSKAQSPTFPQQKAQEPSGTFSIQYRNVDSMQNPMIADSNERRYDRDNIILQDDKHHGDYQSQAARLESSTNKLTSYFRNQIQNGQQIPEIVWDALVEIDSVRKELG